MLNFVTLLKELKSEHIEKQLLFKTTLIKECASIINELEQANKDLLEKFKLMTRRTNEYLLKHVYKIYII